MSFFRNFLLKLHGKISVANRFSAEGCGFWDRCKLWVAGLARTRPFTSASLSGSILAFVIPVVNVRISKAQGRIVRLDLTDFVDLMVFEELVLDGIYPLPVVPFEPEVVIDAGACRGIFTVLASARYPKAKWTCIEPHPDNHARLLRQMEMNGIIADVHHAAISDASGVVHFEGSGFGGAVLESETPGSFEVQTMSLCEYIRGIKPATLLLKMDIEGSEKSVLPRLLGDLPRTTAIFLETHQTDEIVQDYLAPYFAAGFKEQIIRTRIGEEPGEIYVERYLIRDNETLAAQ